MADTLLTDNKTGFLTYSHTIGLCTMEGRGFMFPSDTAFGAGGRHYTVSRGVPGDNRNIRITMYDIEAEYFGTFGGFGTGDGEFLWASGIAIDSTGQVYVSDEHNHRINVFNSDGEYIRNWGEHGEGEAQLNSPSGIAFDSDDNLIVSDHRNHRMQKFTKEGHFLHSFGEQGSGEGQLNLPWGVCVDGNDNVYVADWGNDRAQKFSPAGEFLTSYGTSGRGDGEFKNPSSVVVDREGYIYIADWGNERVQVLDQNGAFVTKLRGESAVSKWAKDFLDTNLEEAGARALANLEPDLSGFAGDPHEESSHTEKFFWGPVSVKLDSEGRLYVTESNRHRVQIYNRGN